MRLFISVLSIFVFLGGRSSEKIAVVGFQYLPPRVGILDFSPGNSLSAAVLLEKTSPPPKRAYKSIISTSSTSLYSVGENNDLCNLETEGNNCLYDYDELLSSDVEKNRLKSMYTRFDHDNWLQHRASDRFYRNLMQNLTTSPIISSLLDEVLLLSFLSLGLIAWNALFATGYADFNGIHHEAPIMVMEDPTFPFNILQNAKLALPIQPFLICGGPLGLLLVFRNDASYQRYNEGLSHIEDIASNFENMLLLSSTTIAGGWGDSGEPPSKEDQIAMVRNLGVASWALMRTLQHELSGKLDPVELYEKDMREKCGVSTLSSSVTSQRFPSAQKVISAKHKLFRTQFDIHQTIEPMTPYITIPAKNTLVGSINEVAKRCIECERMYTTPIPLLYTRHTLKFLTIWMSLMPLALYDVFEDSWNHFLMIPCIAVLTFLFFGIEEIAVYLEEPFSILPLDEMVEDVYNSINDVTVWMMEGEDGDIGDVNEQRSKDAAMAIGN